MIAFWFSDNVDVFALLSELTSMLQVLLLPSFHRSPMETSPSRR